MPFAVTTRSATAIISSSPTGSNRIVRCGTPIHAPRPGSQLIVEVQFLERGAGDKARRVYEPGVETATATPPTAATAAAHHLRPGCRFIVKPPAPETFDARPGAELKGLKSLGVLVEDLGAQAVACGLNQDDLETAVSKRLTDGGFAVRKNSDDDTYVYVNVITTSLVQWHVCLAVRRLSLHARDCQAVVPRSAGAGAGVADAPRWDRQQRAGGTRGGGRAWARRLRRSVRHADPRREQVSNRGRAIVWDVVHRRVPELRAQIAAILES